MNHVTEEQFSELRELFFESASELLQALNEDGLMLENNPGDPEVTVRVRRTVHTLKGDSAAAGYQELSTLAHELEDALTTEIATASRAALANLVLQAADAFGDMLSAYRRGVVPDDHGQMRASIGALIAGKPNGHGPVPVPESASGNFQLSEYQQCELREATERGQAVANIALTIDQACPAAVALQMVQTVLRQAGAVIAMSPENADRPVDLVLALVATAHDARWLKRICHIPAVTTKVEVEFVSANGRENDETAAEATPWLGSAEIAHENAGSTGNPPRPTVDADEFLVATQAPVTRPSDTPEQQSQPATRDTMMRVDVSRIDVALNLVGELILGKSMLMQGIRECEKRFGKDPLCTRLSDAMAFQSRVLSDLQKSVMKIRMVPVEQLFRRFPRMARDLAKSCGKEIALEIAGETTDLDKSILDALAEPLSHIVRNAIDHGIETPEDRVAQGKPRTGNLRLNAYHQGNHIVIDCCDDGRGIDCSKLIAKAIASGVISRDEADRLSESEVLSLVFHAGISTAEQVTTISGRGVGMDVVKTVVDRLKGAVSIDSQAGKGTTFHIRVPLTLAVIKALMFRVDQCLYAVPLASVVEITRARPADIHRVDQHEVLQLRGEVLTLVRLEKLSLRRGPQPQKFFVVVISYAGRKFGLVVDSLIGEEEMVIKAFDDHLVATEFVSGASILGDGSVVLILNTQTLIAKLGRNGEPRLPGANA